MSGIAAVVRCSGNVSEKKALSYLEEMVESISNRGRNGANLLVLNSGADGMVYHSMCQPRQSDEASGNKAVMIHDEDPCIILAHVQGKYDLSGCDGKYQPLISKDYDPLCKFTFTAMSLDGAVVNGEELVDELSGHGIEVRGKGSAEIFLRFFEFICQRDYWQFDMPVDYKRVFREIDRRIDGAISLLLVDSIGNLIAYRNQGGIRPLEFMRTDTNFVLFASENCAFRGFDGELLEIQPSHIKVVNIETGLVVDHFVGEEKHCAKLCAFESIYIGSLETKYHDQTHLETRFKIGVEIGEFASKKINSIRSTYPIIISSMPETGRPYADGLYSSLRHNQSIGLKRLEVIQLNSLVRTLIGDANQRKSLIQKKYHVKDEIVQGRAVVMVDEALIHSYTSKDITKKLLEAGAESVHWVIGSPPVVAPNYYGVEIQKMEELVFWKVWNNLPDSIKKLGMKLQGLNGNLIKFVEDEVAKYIQADSVTYLSLQSLIAVLPGGGNYHDLSPFTLCMPTLGGQRRAEENFRKITS